MTFDRLDNNVIANIRSERVKSVAKLSRRSVRQRDKKFIAEGPQSVREAIKQQGVVQEIYFSERGKEHFPELYEAAVKTNLPLFEATDKVLDHMGPDASHQGWLAVCSHLNTELPENPKLVAYLERLKDPGNVGTIIRVADAVGADAVLLSPESVDIYNSKVVRSTAGSLFHLPVIQDFSLDKALNLRLRSVAAHGYAEHDIFQDDLLNEPTLWIFGNEAHGVEDSTLQKVDSALFIPIFGQAESLNVSTAATVCLYTSCQAQRV